MQIRFFSLLLLTALLGGCGSSFQDTPSGMSGGSLAWTAPDPALRAVELQALLDEAMQTERIPGAIVGVWTPAGSWTSATGIADIPANRAATLSDNSAWRSITKSLTVTVVLQLADEGLVELDAPLSRYLTGVTGGDQVTLRQLANMTSGVVNYSSDPDFQAVFIQDIEQAFTLDELLGFVVDQPLNFAPGTAYEYSNSNTLLLQKVAETVTGRTLEQLYEERILSRLPAGSAQYLLGTEFPSPHLNGYAYDDETDSFEELVSNTTALAGAGAMVGTLEGLRDWGRLLVRGDLLSPALQAQRFVGRPPTNGPLYDAYGLGMGEIGGWWGHTGTGLGYQACVFTEPNSLSSIVIFVNATNQDGDVPAKLARRIQSVLGWSR